jgi:hypothetical protein
MAYFYVDVATGTDSLGNGGSWAAACATLKYLCETATANPAAGDVVYMRANASETTKETYAASTSITGAGSLKNPIRVIGVKSGTTNTGASVVASDIAVRSGDQPVIQVTGTTTNDLGLDGSFVFYGINIDVDRRFNSEGTHNRIKEFHECDITTGGTIRTNDWDTLWHFHNCTIDSAITLQGHGHHRYINCTFTFNGANFFGGMNTTSYTEIIGCDFSSMVLSGALFGDNDISGRIELQNCKMPASYNKHTLTPVAGEGYFQMVGCSDNTAAKGNTTSYQDFWKRTAWGIVENEATVVRTGGATDGATGTFSYKLTPDTDSVAPGSTCGSAACSVASPWLRVWVAGGSSITLTVYTTHDNAGTLGRDLYRNELWCEFYTPDSGDEAQHDQALLDNANDFLLDGTTSAGTDDTTSTWGTHNTYKRSFSTTVTPGFEGFAYARVHNAHRDATNPVTVYVDPQIEVT